jgi:hypothetical protein
MFDQIALLALLLFAGGTASVALTPLLLAAPSGLTLAAVETTIGTTVVCTSIGIAFQRYGLVAGVGAIAIAFLVNRAVSVSHHRHAERLCAWGSAAALLAYIAQSSA